MSVEPEATVSYKKNDLVWAKMKGFSPWPGKITDPPAELRKGPKKSVVSQCIFFFGTKNYAWIEEQNIKPYLSFKNDLFRSNKSGAFRDAVKQIESYMVNPEKFEAENFTTTVNTVSVEDQFNRLRDGSESSEPASPTTSKSPPKKDARKLKSILVKSRRDRRETASLPTSKRKNDSPVSNDRRKRFLASTADDAIPSTSRGIPALLNRPVVQQPEIPELDMSSNIVEIKSRNIKPTNLKIGFLGLGIMGSIIVKRLIHTGHKVIVWNRTAEKCRKFVEEGADFGRTPCDVIEAADITFSCVADPQASKDIVFGNCGVLQAENGVKGYIELSTIDPETSQDISEAIQGKGGRYLEVQIQGSQPQAENGSLVFIAAGDRTLFADCHSCFESVGKDSFYMGDVGNACKVNLVIQCMVGVTLAGLAEGMALADRCGINLRDVLDIIQLTPFSSQLIVHKATEIFENVFNPKHPLAHMQKDLRLSLGMAEMLEHSMPTTAVTNEVYKHAKRLGYGKHDASAVYVRARF